jgi:dsDNA-specific endonuclease/ATPase MutS2
MARRSPHPVYVRHDRDVAPEDDDLQDPDELVRVEMTTELDLHPFPPRDVKDVVQAYLDHAAAQGWPHVRIIHGKGIGVQRETVRRVAARHPAVRRVLPDDRGDWGSTVIELAPRGGG